MEILFCFAFGVLLYVACAEFCLCNYRTAMVCSTLAFAVFIGLLCYTWHNNTSRVYQMHDVKLRIYYLDGSTRDINLECVSKDIPYIDARFKQPDLVIDRGRIPCVDRFDILEERCYEMTGSELRNKGRHLNRR